MEGNDVLAVDAKIGNTFIVELETILFFLTTIKIESEIIVRWPKRESITTIISFLRQQVGFPHKMA